MSNKETFQKILEQLEDMRKEGYTIMNHDFRALCEMRNELKRKIDNSEPSRDYKKFMED